MLKFHETSACFIYVALNFHSQSAERADWKRCLQGVPVIQFILRSHTPKESKSKEDPVRTIMIPEKMNDHNRMLGFAKLFMKARTI